MEFRDVVNNRYSCKQFSEKDIEFSQIEAILHAGRAAPTAKNSQEQRVYVLRSKEALEKIDSVTPCRYGAPAVIVVAYDKNGVFTYPGGKVDSGAEDASIVATHMMLAATDEGLDSCWINFFDPDKAKEVLELPENEEVVMLLDIGYKAHDFEPLPNHYSRKEILETVKFL